MSRRFLSLGLLALLGCNTPKPTPAAHSAAPMSTTGASTPRPGYVGEDKQVERGTLQFANADEAKRFDTLHACLKRDLPGFYAYPMRSYGNYVNVEWCKGKGAHINCAGGETRKTPGAAWTSLQVMHYPQSWPKVFGLGVSVGEIPEAGIGAAISYGTGGKGISGEHAHFTFYEVKGGKVATRLGLTIADEMKLGETAIRVRAEGTEAAFFARVRSSPEALKKEIDERLGALEKAVTEALEADTPRKCVYGEYEGNGIPPECVKKVPLDVADKKKARAKLAAYVSGGRALAASHAPALHAKVVELLPPRCLTP